MRSDELSSAQAAMKERGNHYDRRAGNGQLAQERQQQKELRTIKRKQRKIVASLEAADDVQSKRLLWDILDRERDRIEGRPHTATPPPKPSAIDPRLQDYAINALVVRGQPKPTAEPPSPEPSEPELESGEPAHVDQLIEQIREIGRLRN